MAYPLSTFLNSISDFRRGEGQRYPLPKVLLMIVMSIINGASGYREMARFMENHQETFIELLSLKHGVPSHVTVREILLGINLEEFNKKFLLWMSGELTTPQNKWVSMDGKAIRSTLDKKVKKFVQVVSIFAHHSELVIGQSSFKEKKSTEAGCVRQMIKDLDQTGVFICLDALHCQKKH